MMKDSGRKCSQCGHNGHNSRTCHGKGYSFKLFGASIAKERKEDEFIRKSKSTGSLITCNAEQSAGETGYLSDCLIHSKKAKTVHESTSQKGFPWTEVEHQCFLLGLDKLGKGDWKGISRSYVPSRTPSQIASHAQKYFLRMAASEDKKRRRSLFDVPFKEPEYPPVFTVSPSNTSPQISQQAMTTVQVANPMEASKILPMPAAYGVPDSYPVPNMVGVPRNLSFHEANRILSSLSFVTVNNFSNQGCVYFPRNDGNLANCAPFLPQVWSDLVPQPSPVGPSQTHSGTSLTKLDGLELTL